MSTIEQTFDVQGMTCAHCELSVQGEVAGLDGVDSAVANRDRGTLLVRGDVDADAVHSAVQAAGYEVRS